MDLTPQIIWDRQDKIDVKDAHLAVYARLDRSLLSRVRKGMGLTYPQHKALNAALDDLEELHRRAKGIPIDWSDLRAVGRMLDALKKERQEPPSTPTDQDLDIFQRFSRGEDLDEISIRHNIDKTTVLSRVEAVLQRGEYLTRTAVQQ